jgi:hypothetical protein
MEQIVHHICGNFILINITFSLPLGLSIAGMIDRYIGNVISGNTYCWIFFYIQNLNLIYHGADGLAIAVIRFFYIKKGSWLKYKFGERKLLLLFGITIWAFSFVMMYLYGSENISNRSLCNMCKGHTQAFEVIVNYILLVQKANNHTLGCIQLNTLFYYYDDIYLSPDSYTCCNLNDRSTN